MTPPSLLSCCVVEACFFGRRCCFCLGAAVVFGRCCWAEEALALFALACQAICPWNASFDGDAGTAKFQQAVRQGGLSAAELLEQTRECGNIFGINAFDSCLPPKSTTEVCDIPCLQHGRNDFKFGVVVHNCNPAADPDNNCGCLNASAVLLPRADHNGQPLRLADSTAKTCILAQDVARGAKALNPNHCTDLALAALSRAAPTEAGTPALSLLGHSVQACALTTYYRSPLLQAPQPVALPHHHGCLSEKP